MQKRNSADISAPQLLHCFILILFEFFHFVQSHIDEDQNHNPYDHNKRNHLRISWEDGGIPKTMKHNGDGKDFQKLLIGEDGQLWAECTDPYTGETFLTQEKNLLC